MARKCPALLALLAAAGMGAGALASEWASADYGFKVTCPDGGNWKPVKIGLLREPVFALAEVDAVIPARVHRGFSVEAYARESKQYDWCDSGINIVHRALANQHRARKISGRLSTFNGLPAYECTAELVRPDDVGQVRITGILTDRYWYYISIVKFPGDPAADPELQAMFRSFQLTGHPRPPPPPPLMPAWLPGVAVIAIAVVVAASGLLLVQRLRRNRTRPRRMRYTYSEKAQELAGNRPDAGTAAGRVEVSLGWDLGQQEREMKSALRSPNLLVARGIAGPLMSMSPPPPDPKEFGKHLGTSPLKLDRRFLKQKPKADPPAAKPAPSPAPAAAAAPAAATEYAVFRAEAVFYVRGRGLMLDGTIVSGAVRPDMSFTVPGFPVRLTIQTIEPVSGGRGIDLVGLVLQDVSAELAEAWQSLDVAGQELTIESAATDG